MLGGLVSGDGFRFSLGPLISWNFPNIAASRARIRQAGATAEGALANFDKADANKDGILSQAELLLVVRDEAARALVLWGALQVDIMRKAQTEEERVAAELQQHAVLGVGDAEQIREAGVDGIGHLLGGNPFWEGDLDRPVPAGDGPGGRLRHPGHAPGLRPARWVRRARMHRNLPASRKRSIRLCVHPASTGRRRQTSIRSYHTSP